MARSLLNPMIQAELEKLGAKSARARDKMVFWVLIAVMVILIGIAFTQSPIHMPSFLRIPW